MLLKAKSDYQAETNTTEYSGDVKLNRYQEELIRIPALRNAPIGMKDGIDIEDIDIDKFNTKKRCTKLTSNR